MSIGIHFRPKPRRLLLILGGLFIVAALLIAGIVVQLDRPIPAVRARLLVGSSVTVADDGWSLPYPRGTESAVLLAGFGQVGVSGGDAAEPVASATKLMSALVVLSDHPLRPGQSGPSLLISPRDVASYNREKSADDSVVEVRAGERLSELDALEATLVPSADNVIDLLATWDAGSTRAFVDRMNAEARRLGLQNTHYADPSGLSPQSVSTATDQARLAEAALQNPVIADIVALPEVTLPVAGVQYNVDADLGQDGIVGVKTGWTPEAGASFVFAAKDKVSGDPEMIVGAVVGQKAIPAIPTVLANALHLVTAAEAGIGEHVVITAGEQVGTIEGGDGRRATIVAASTVRFITWPGARVTVSVALASGLRSPIEQGHRVGSLVVQFGVQHTTVPLVAGGNLGSPSLAWRLFRL
jgi:D-alanyl-D-alanine carboxypeptidase (penicillin-binding protein 5/6)